jgi:Mg-chelatase subunit ChlD
MTAKKFISMFLVFAMSVSILAVNIPVVNADSTPDFTITKSINRTAFTQGESAKLTYTFIPSGKAPVQSKKDADIVMLLDISTSMADSSKIVKAVDAAAQFFNKLNGTGFKASLVTFGYKVSYSSSLTTSYSTLINQVNKYKQYNSYTGYFNLMSGTNYDDALKKAKQILAAGTAKNKYVLFITDGMPNYFTSKTRISKYDSNIYREVEGGTYYYTNHPKSTPEAYSEAIKDVNELEDSGAAVFTLGVGKGNEVDMNFLQELTQAGSGKLYQVVDPNSMSDIFAQISEDISDISFSAIKIKERLPEGISLGINNNASIDENGYVVINVPPITYKKGAAIPPEPFAVDLNLSLNKSGSYVLNDSKVQYKDWNGKAFVKTINSISLGVTAAEGAPTLKISKVMSNNSAIVGETKYLEYIITPEGAFNSKTGPNSSLKYSFRNLVITEELPAGVEILDSDNPSRFTAVIPDIVFTDGMGTPSPVALSIKVKFNNVGKYNLSNISKLTYLDNDGSAKVLNFNKLEINVANPNYRIDKLVASKYYEGDAFKGIMLNWSENLLNDIGAISKFIVMRSINGSEYKEVVRLNNNKLTYLDTDTGINGRYIYRIDVLMNNGNIVIGIPSNEVLLLGQGKTNIGSVSQSIQINGEIITKAYESYKLNYMIGLSISNGTEGKTGGGIKEPEFDILLNSAGKAEILYLVKDGSLKLIDGAGNQITDSLSWEIKDNGTANAGLKITYDKVLAPGDYKIVFDAEPKKAQGTVLPEQGTEVVLQLNIRWKDVGFDDIVNNSSNAFDETDSSKQLQYKLWILPLPKLL